MKSVREASTGDEKARDRTASSPPKAAGSPPPAEQQWGYEPGGEPQDLAPIVGGNLRRLRVRRGLSLEKLAQKSGVSRAMLGQIELGQSAPTINVLWKIARALDVTFATLIQAREAGGTVLLKRPQTKVLTSQNGQFSSRALFPFDGPRRAEFYELRLAAHSTEEAEAHAPGTVENLIVSEGAVEVRIGDENYKLETGDAILFEADVHHAYVNSQAAPAVMYLVMTYAEEQG